MNSIRASTYLLLLVAGSFLGAGLPLGLAPTASAAASEVSFQDPTGDVRLANSALPPTADVGPLQPIDIKSARAFGETGTSFLIQVEMTKLGSETLPPVLIYANTVVACFKWNGQPFAAIVNFQIGPGIIRQPYLTAVDGECKADTPVKPITGKSALLWGNINLDVPHNRVTIGIPRAMLGQVAGASPPKIGDTISNLYILSYDSTNNGNARVRLDVAPDGGPDGQTLTLNSNTGGQGTLRAFADSNIATVPCAGRFDTRSYSFEAGGRRGIPITFQNLASAPTDILFTVETAGGADWKPKIVPTLTLDPFSEAGNITVTAIVETAANTNHKDCSILLVRGTDKNDPSNFAEAIVSAIAVRPPDPEHKRLFYHDNELAHDFCGWRYMWLNTLEKDPEDANQPILMKGCKDAQVASNADGSWSTSLDVNPNKDLVINTSAVGKDVVATLRFVSTGVDTSARISVSLTSKPIGADSADQVFAEGFTDTKLTTSGTSVVVAMHVPFTRDEVPTGDPSRTIMAEDGLALFVKYEPKPADGLPVDAQVAGVVNFWPQGSYVDIPVWATIRRNTADPGQGGALISLKAVDELPRFAAPGAPRLFNYTVLNEGPEPDVGVFEATTTGPKGWTAVFLPGDKVPLAPGERKVIQAALTPPATANESESVVFDVVVHSEKDPTARSSVSTKVVATREGGVPVEVITSAGGGGKKGLLPAPGIVEVLALVGLVAVVGARRRSPPRHP